MFYIHYVFAALCLISFCSGDEQTCSIDGIDLDSYMPHENKKIGDTIKANTVIFSKGVKGITDIKLDAYYSEDYFDASLKDGQLIIKTTDKFEKFEEVETISYYDEEFKFYLELAITCGNQHKYLKIYQPVIDTNNHKPRFNRNTYNYKFGMPIKEGVELNKLLEIFVADLDITNTNIEFSIAKHEDLFEIVNSTCGQIICNSNKKLYWAALKTKKELNYGTYDFDIIAKDVVLDSDARSEGKAKVLVEIVKDE